jgi:hypothetical protein
MNLYNSVEISCCFPMGITGRLSHSKGGEFLNSLPLSNHPSPGVSSKKLQDLATRGALGSETAKYRN